MHEDLIKRLRNSEHEIYCSLCDRDCCYPDGKVHGKCIIIEAADAMEEQDRHILTLQHEMMDEAESHIVLVERLNKQIEELQADVRPVVKAIWKHVQWVVDEEWQEGGYWISRCSNCSMPYHTETPFCPHCGADMREESRCMTN